MQWQDTGIILATKRFGESALKLDVFTPTIGRASGLVKGGSSKKRKPQFDTGNIVDLTWRGRLNEQLGQFTVELIKQPSATCLNNPLALNVLGSACGLLHQCLAEHHPEKPLYQQCNTLLSCLTHDKLELLSAYIWFEIELLSASGFPLDLTQCAATGSSDELIYLSPKSGRAVCAEAGKPYHDKLFALPSFMLKPHRAALYIGEIMQAFQITSYFLDHIASDILHAPICEARTRLLEQYSRENQKPRTLIGHNSQQLETL